MASTAENPKKKKVKMMATYKSKAHGLLKNKEVKEKEEQNKEEDNAAQTVSKFVEPTWKGKMIRKVTTKSPPKSIREVAEEICERIDTEDAEVEAKERLTLVEWDCKQVKQMKREKRRKMIPLEGVIDVEQTSKAPSPIVEPTEQLSNVEHDEIAWTTVMLGPNEDNKIAGMAVMPEPHEDDEMAWTAIMPEPNEDDEMAIKVPTPEPKKRMKRLRKMTLKKSIVEKKETKKNKAE